MILDDFVRKLKDDQYEIPLNDISKELKRENDLLKNKIEILSSP